MSKLIFNTHTRQFSVIDDRMFDDNPSWISRAASAAGSHISRNSGKYVAGGITAAGAGLGYMKAKNKAQLEALNKGFKPGTPEYNAYVSSKAKSGAMRGAVAGGIAGAATGTAIGTYKGVRDGVRSIKNIGNELLNGTK